ncbi:nuclear transport factor 2 family protein [Plantactinospora sp. CA-294935]|uniref:nuclear transport factor 2 family protein n=1 Tax=Plantactinospora sp. CA-294935 TaxID=3240012 RepID=UPI003D8E8C1D
MSDDSRIEALRAAERRLQAAQLSSDVAELDRLLDERLVFTGPGGRLYDKGDDLRLHRTGEQVLTEAKEEELTVLVSGDTGVTWFLGTLTGVLAGTPFTARVRYTRTWIHTEGSGWRLLAAHVSAL